VTTTANTTSTIISGDVALASKPTWADFDPIATIYPTSEDLALGPITNKTVTPTNFGTIGNDKINLFRIGNKLRVDGLFQAGTAAGSPYFQLPSGLTVDSDYYDAGSTTRVGTWSKIKNASGAVNYTDTAYNGACYTAITTEQDKIRIGYENQSGLYSNNQPLGNNDWLSFSFEVYIEEWRDIGQVPPIGLEIAANGSPGVD